MKCHIVSVLLLSLGAFLLCSSCKNNAPQEIPKTLHLAAEIPNEYASEVASYKVDYYIPDEQVTVGTWMHHEPQGCHEDYAQGPQYYYETAGKREYINIYSDVLKGGFSYSSYETSEDNLRSDALLCSLRKRRPQEFVRMDYTPLIMGNESMEPASAENLDFMTYEDALRELESKLTAVNFPEYELLSGEAHSLYLMNKNLEVYNQAAKAAGYESFEYTPNIDDEYYYFAFRQVKDGIPFCNTIWQRQAIGEIGVQEITAIMDRSGLIDFWASDICVIGDAVSKESIISPQEALDVYVDEYSKAIHFTDTDILDIELNYVINVDRDGMYARPAWIITTSTLIRAEDIDNGDVDVNEYAVTAVSAYSGVILERETDMR